MGFEDMIKDGEQALDGQTSADQVAANQASGKGNDATFDTLVDSGKLARTVTLALYDK